MLYANRPSFWNSLLRNLYHEWPFSTMGQWNAIPRYFFDQLSGFSCSFDQAKRAYYRSLNALFGKLGRFASEEVILQLVESKCLPISMYGTEACCLKKWDINSLDFAVNRFLIKLFKTNNMSIIDDCRMYFNFKLPSALLVTRKASLLDKYSSCNNNLCKQFLTLK